MPLDTIKFRSRKDRNLKEVLSLSVPHAHRKDQESNQLGSCSRYGSQRCGLCKTGIQLKPMNFAVLPLDLNIVLLCLKNCISVNCILCKLGSIWPTSKQARTRWANHKYDIKSSRIEQSGLTDHLHKGSTIINLLSKRVAEINVNNVCVLCELEKNWINSFTDI